VRIAILILNNFGDILYATPIARQIKEIDFPNCTLTWIVSRQCSSLLTNHPFIDYLEIVELNNLGEVNSSKWETIRDFYISEVKKKVYDELFILQPIRGNFLRYRWGIRQMIIDAYPHKIKVPLTPIINLSSVETSRVSHFVDQNGILNYKNRILFEFSPKSGQSKLTQEMAINLAKGVVGMNESTCIILSSNISLELNHSGVFNANNLSFKENAELLNNCTLLVGCSSGISWLSTSTWCKQINTIQFLNYEVPWFNSMKVDFEQNNLDSAKLLELYEFSGQSLLEVINFSLNEDFNRAKQKFDQPLPVEALNRNFRTIAYELEHSSSKDFVIFVLKNFYRKVFFNRFYFAMLRKIGYQYVKSVLKY
jgi:hypothetical protein